MSFLAKATLAMLVALVAVNSAAAAPARPYRTDAQAAKFLEHGLQRWAGINLHAQDIVSASCFNGYYSKIEQRSGRHFTQGRTNRFGEYLYASFACSLEVGSRSFNLYVLPRFGSPAWSVRADR